MQRFNRGGKWLTLEQVKALENPKKEKKLEPKKEEEVKVEEPKKEEEVKVEEPKKEEEVNKTKK